MQFNDSSIQFTEALGITRAREIQLDNAVTDALHALKGNLSLQTISSAMAPLIQTEGEAFYVGSLVTYALQKAYELQP